MRWHEWIEGCHQSISLIKVILEMCVDSQHTWNWSSFLNFHLITSNCGLPYIKCRFSKRPFLHLWGHNQVWIGVESNGLSLFHGSMVCLSINWLVIRGDGYIQPKDSRVSQEPEYFKFSSSPSKIIDNYSNKWQIFEFHQYNHPTMVMSHRVLTPWLGLGVCEVYCA